MKYLTSLLLSFFFAIASSSNRTVAQENLGTLESAKTFMAAYANDLNSANRTAIIQRYDPRGHYQLGNGRKTFLSQSRNRCYLENGVHQVRLTGMIYLFEVLGPEAIVVTGLFDWVATNGEKRTLLLFLSAIASKREWKIRVEDESRAFA